MKKNVMVVDQTSFNRTAIKNILNKAGYNVIAEAGTGIKAVEKFKTYKPDLVVMDVQIPEMDGIEALKVIKDLDSDTPVIMCSAAGQQTVVLEAVRAGASDFIVKPFQPDRVIEAVKKCLG